MKPTTLVYPFRKDGYILLGKKKRGFGIQKWNGFGGKVQEGESLTACAVRELAEESGLQAQEKDLKEVAYLEFIFPATPELDHPGNVYFIDTFTGELHETKEMEPRWFSIDSLPYDEMWSADKIWLPKLLQGKYLRGRIIFADNNDDFISCELTEIEDDRER